MRLDKFLKNTRIIRRRPVAKAIASQGRVEINSHIAKPGTQVSSNDVIKIHFGNKTLTIRANQILKHPKKIDASRMYTVLNVNYKRDYHKENKDLKNRVNKYKKE